MSDNDDKPSIAESIRDQKDMASTALVKAVLVGGDLGRTEQIQPEEQQALFGKLGALDPPYDPEMLCILFEHSNSLRQNVDAYCTNIHAFGHRFEPVFDLDGEDADEELETELEMRGAEEKKDDPKSEQEMGDRVQALRGKLRAEMRRERIRLRNFFKFCCQDESFVQLRKITCQDLETQGNAYWEIMRDLEGEISQFAHVPAFTMRLMPLDEEPVDVEERVRVSVTGFKTRSVRKQFRKFVQRVEDNVVFFKEFGDPRVISHATGIAYKDAAMLKREEEGAGRPATEVLQFRIHNMRGPYGVPRWIGNLLSVLGSRQSEEVNFLYFENKAVPPMAMLVSGGRISANSVQRIEDYIETNIKGKRNWHKILILEAEPAIGSVNSETSSRMKIELKPLLGAIHQDALFQKYDEKSRDKVGESFRIPRLLRGDMRDFNRSTAFAALNFAEQQVFQPERQEFDFLINRKILPALDARYHEMVSLAPVTRDPVAMATMVKDLTNANVLVPSEGRELAGDIFNRIFKRIDAIWTKQPAAFTLAGMDFSEASDARGQHVPTDQPGASEPAARADKGLGPLGEMARLLAGMRGAMRQAKADEDHASFAKRHAQLNDPDPDADVVKVDADTFNSWFEGGSAE